MSPVGWTLADLDRRFPRVSGDEPRHLTKTGMGPEFSPRERG